MAVGPGPRLTLGRSTPWWRIVAPGCSRRRTTPGRVRSGGPERGPSTTGRTWTGSACTHHWEAAGERVVVDAVKQVDHPADDGEPEGLGRGSARSGHIDETDGRGLRTLQALRSGFHLNLCKIVRKHEPIPSGATLRLAPEVLRIDSTSSGLGTRRPFGASESMSPASSRCSETAPVEAIPQQLHHRRHRSSPNTPRRYIHPPPSSQRPTQTNPNGAPLSAIFPCSPAIEFAWRLQGFASKKRRTMPIKSRKIKLIPPLSHLRGPYHCLVIESRTKGSFIVAELGQWDLAPKSLLEPQELVSSDVYSELLRAEEHVMVNCRRLCDRVR
jgi:hypothetical protein